MITIRRATVADVKSMQELINYYADRGEMLHRSLSELYDNIRDFFICEEEGEFVGCCALHIWWDDLAEIRSLAVAPGRRSNSIGTRLLRHCLEDAKALRVERVFALTRRPGFFEKNGFVRIQLDELPQKVWGDCIKCVKFTDCDEEAMIYTVKGEGENEE
ncbi:MAG: N-acetyltransferase [bacterium]